MSGRGLEKKAPPESGSASGERPSVSIERVEADQRFAFSAENISPQPWRWKVSSENYVDWGYAAWRWTARLWTWMRSAEFAYRERMRRRTRPGT